MNNLKIHVTKNGEVLYKKDFTLDSDFFNFVKLLSLKHKTEIAIALFKFRLSTIESDITEEYSVDVEKLCPINLKEELENFDFNNSVNNVEVFASYISNYVYIRLLTFFKKYIIQNANIYNDIYSSVIECFNLFTTV